MQFPAPTRLNGSTRWRLSDLLAYEAAQNGEAAPVLSAGEERYLHDRQVAARYAVARGTIWRWIREGGA